MERLTRKFLVQETGKVLAYLLNSGVSETKARNKLGAYEDAEEQGLLLRLPCKVGDTVYVISSYLGCTYNYQCGLKHDKYKCEENVPCEEEHRFYFVVDRKFIIEMLNTIGETIFLTREEAEAVLEKMKGEGNEKTD